TQHWPKYQLRIAMLDLLPDTDQPFHGDFCQIHVEGDLILCLAQSLPFDQIDVIFGVIRHDEDRWRIESLDEQPTFVVGRRVHWSEQRFQTFSRRPGPNGGEKSFAYL